MYKRKFSIFSYGAIGYVCLEIIARGTSHWSMALAGGSCLLLIFDISRRLAPKPIFLQAAAAALGITAIEFVFGVVFNLWLGMSVWDYAGMPGNLLGQVCPQYTLLWMALCMPALLYFRAPRA